MIPPEFYSMDTDIDMDTDFEAETPIDDASVTSQLLLQSIVSAELPPDESFHYSANEETITQSQVKRFQEHNQDLAAVSSDAAFDSVSWPATTAVSVSTFERAVKNLAHDPAAPSFQQLSPFASIQEVSTHIHLNYQQHVAFALIAVPLLRRINGTPTTTASHAIFDDSPLIITGAAGTGKSQIVAAVRALAAAWDRPRSVAVVASTGIAAATLQGSTLHSLGLGIKAKVVPKSIKSPSDSLLQQWAPVMCVIADELSMTDLGFFGLWEESLQYAKDAKGQDYGGLLTVLMFDHCQLHTVSGLRMFKTTNGSSRLTPPQERGCLLYHKISKVVYMTENMRFVADADWGRWLASARLGIWTSELRSYIASISHMEHRPTCTPHGPLLTVSSDNATRVATNDMAIRLAVRSFGSDRKVYVIPAQLSRQLLPYELDLIRQLPDNKTGHIPLFLQLYIGMRVRVKANQCLSKGVANGAPAIVDHIDWHEDTTFTLQSDGTWMASHQPRNVYLNLIKCPSPERFPSIPLHWPPSVMPIHLATFSIQLLRSSVSIKGFPIVPAFGTTVHGVQGETLDALVVANLKPPHVHNVDSHALYVALSRIRTRHGLYLTGPPPTSDDFDFFHPDRDVIVEDSRLRSLADDTVEAFEGVNLM